MAPPTAWRETFCVVSLSESLQLGFDVPGLDGRAIPLQRHMLALHGPRECFGTEDRDAFTACIAHAVVDDAPASCFAQLGAEHLRCSVVVRRINSGQPLLRAANIVQW